MKVLKQERQKNTVTLEIEVPYSDFKTASDQALAEAGRQMKLPGFRPGKAPQAMVQKAIDPRAVEDRAAQNLISSLYPQVLKETKLDPVDYPSVEIITLEEGKPFVFKLSIAVYPEVKLGKYKGLKVTKKPEEVTEEDVLKALGNLQNRLAKRVEVKDRPLKKNDWADFTIEAMAEGAAIKRWPRKMQFFPVGMGAIHQDFDAQISGMNLNETKEFKITFPPNYVVPEIAGKEVNFKIKLEKIQTRELLPLDDEFSKKVSRFGTLAELKAEVKKSLEAERKEESEADLKNKLIGEITKSLEVDLPEALSRAETDLMLDELKTSLSRSNLTIADYLKSLKKTEDDLRRDFKSVAEQRALGKVALKKISEVENLTATPQETEAEIKFMARTLRQPEAEYKKTLSEGGFKYIEDYISRRKALDLVVKSAQVSEERSK